MTIPDVAEEQAFGMDDLAARWRVNYKTVKKLLDEGEIPYFMVGVQRRVSLEDVLAYEAKKVRKGRKR